MRTSVPDLTIGLDLGDRTTQVCVLDSEGGIVGETVLPTDRDSLEVLFNQVAGVRARVVCEVGSQSRWVQKFARECGIDDSIATNPRKLRLISDSLKKSDRSDAYVLARAGQSMPELLSPIEHVSDEIYADRALLESRDQLVQMRTRLVTRIRALVKTSSKKLERCSPESFHHKAPEHIPEHLRPACKPLFSMLEALEPQIRQIEKELRKLIRQKYPIAAKLQEIAGVGCIVALSFVLTVGDPSRFGDARAIGAYFGLTPRKQQSGNSNPQLGITKAGNRGMRCRLVLAAHCLLARGEDCALKRWALKLCERGGRNAKKRAIIALARKLAVIMLAIWRNDSAYDPWRGVPVSERLGLASAA
jgi:transposase